MADTQQFIDIGHTRVAHTQTGTGPDVLFIHGWPLHGGTWRNIVPELDGFRCHVIDLPGAGGSKATPDTPLNIEGMVASIGAVIDHLNLSSCSLVSHDSGAMFARMVARSRPEQVNGLVLSGTEIPGHTSWQVVLFGLLARLPAAGNIFELLVGNDVLVKSPLVLGGCFADTDHIRGDFADILGALFADDALMDSALEVLKNFNHDAVDGLALVHAELSMPSLLIWGEDDPFFPLEKARAMASQFGGETRFETVANAKLFVHEEHPARYGRLTREFLLSIA